MPKRTGEITRLAAMRLCGWRSRATVMNYAARGLIRLRDDADGHFVAVAPLLTAPTLLIGRFALCTGVSRRRIRHAVRDGLVRAKVPWRGAPGRFRLADVVPFRDAMRKAGRARPKLNDAGERRIGWLRGHVANG